MEHALVFDLKVIKPLRLRVEVVDSGFVLTKIRVNLTRGFIL